MTAQLLTTIAGVLISLAFSYVPGASDWFAKLDGTYKRLVMLAALLLAAGGAFGLGCAGYSTGVPCDGHGALKMLELFILAAMANQSAFLLTPKKK